MKITIINKYYDKTYGCWVRDFVIEKPNFKKTYVIGGYCWERLLPAGAIEALRMAKKNKSSVVIVRKMQGKEWK